LSYTKTIICLANSRKPPSGRCIAGREKLSNRFGAWVRPVSTRPTREIAEEERRYQDGSDPKVLDVIAIEMTTTQPHDHQQENHVIDDSYYWTKQGAASWSEIQSMVEDPDGPLWLNGYSSSYGENDRVPEADLAALDRSLYLVRPEDLRIVVASEGGDFAPSRRRVRARFELCGMSYCFVVTDPPVEREYLLMGDGETAIAEALLCVSLAEVFNGYAYKLVASMITPQRTGG
jgi:hypothetical protein